MSGKLPRKSPVDVKSRILKYQTKQESVPSSTPSTIPKGISGSKSIGDFRARTLYGSPAEDGWMTITTKEDSPPKERLSPGMPSKQPHAQTRSNDIPHKPQPPPKVKTPPIKPRVPKLPPAQPMGSTDLFLLPQQSKSVTSVTNRALPPRPPPPSQSLKPTKRPSVDHRPEKTSTGGKGGSGGAPDSSKPHITTTSEPTVGVTKTVTFQEGGSPVLGQRKSPQLPHRDIMKSPQLSHRDMKRLSNETDSLSDSMEEKSPIVSEPPTPTSATFTRTGSIFSRFQRASVTQPDQSLPASSELEESFDVIPGTDSKFKDMVEQMKETDAKLHDASIYEVVQAVAREIPQCASTKDLPFMIEGFPSGSRENYIHELYKTEYTYVNQLEVIIEVYKVQLSPLLGDMSSQIFANVEDILAFNRGLLALLHTRLKDWSPNQCIGDIFLGMFNQTHKSMYAIYCSNFDTAEQQLLRTKTRRKDVETQLIHCSNDGRVAKGLNLPMYLITPVQRVPRYILLLKDIIKYTNESHPDYQSLQQAKDKMGELADYINLQIQESQTKKTLQSLKTKVHGLSDLEQPSRSLVKDGQLYLKEIKRLYQCILFNDILVFALGSSRQSKVELQLPLEALWIEDLEDKDPLTSDELAVEVYTPQRPYIIYMQSNSEKKLWVPKIRETIYNHLLANDQITRNTTLDITTRFSNFVYTDQRLYKGHYKDSLRHGKGAMTWPNHSQYIGDWVENEREGEGIFHYNTGESYDGAWKDDKQNGFGELEYYTGDTYRGHWRDGLRHGKGKILYSNGDTFEGTFELGHIEGRGILKCVNGVSYDGEWKNSHRHGTGTLKTIQGHIYTGDFRNNQIHGQGRMVYSNGDSYNGGWKNGMRQGQGNFISKRQGTYIGAWDRDLRHGKGTLEYRNKDFYDGWWEYNKRHGKGIMKLSTGEVYTGDFQNDMMHGSGEMIYGDNMVYKGTWHHNLRHGEGTMVYEDESEYIGSWEMGLRHGEGNLKYKNGITYAGHWYQDSPHGEKGELAIPSAKYKYVGDWVNGKKEGRGLEAAEYGTYTGGWKSDMKHGAGEEKTTVGTTFKGRWERGRKHGQGERKIAHGLVDEQHWKSGQLQSDPLRMTAVELPYISRNDL